MSTPKTLHYPCCFTLELNPCVLPGFLHFRHLFYPCFMGTKRNILIESLDVNWLDITNCLLKARIMVNFVPKARVWEQNKRQGYKKRAYGNSLYSYWQIAEGAIS